MVKLIKKFKLKLFLFDGITYYVVVVNAKVVEVRYHRGDYTIIINNDGTTSEKIPMTQPTGNGTLYPE